MCVIYLLYVPVQKWPIHTQGIRTIPRVNHTPYVVSKFILSNIARLSIVPRFADPLTADPLAVPFVAVPFVAVPFVAAPFVVVPFVPTSRPLATPFSFINFTPSSALRKSIPLAGLSSLFPLLLLGPPAQLIGLRLLSRLVIPPPIPAALHLFLCGVGVSSSPNCCLTKGTSA